MDIQLDPAKLDAAERQIDALIDRRGRDAANKEADMWSASERRHREEQQREHAAAWHAFHVGQAERLERTAAELAANHRRRAQALEGTG